MRTWRKQYAHLDEEQVAAELRAWLAEPRTNDDIREHVGATRASPRSRGRRSSSPARCCRSSSSRPRGTGRTRRRPSSSSTRARCPTRSTPRRSCSSATRGLRPRQPARRRRLGRRRPARLRRRVGAARDRQLPRRAAAPSCSTSPAGRCRPPRRRCPRASSRTGTSRCSPTPTASASSPPEVQPLKLTLSGEPTVTVDGRVAASWRVEREGDAVRLAVTPHVEIAAPHAPRSAPRPSGPRVSASPTRARRGGRGGVLEPAAELLDQRRPAVRLARGVPRWAV